MQEITVLDREIKKKKKRGTDMSDMLMLAGP